MTRAIGYIRVSTEDQAHHGIGLDAQRDALRAYAARESLDLVSIEVDGGVSGATRIEDRPGLMNLLAELRRGDLLLVAKRDRLGRDPYIVIDLERRIEKLGARIVSTAGEGTADDSIGSVFMRRILDGAAEYELGAIRERSKNGHAAKRSRGEVTGHARYGSKVDPADPRRSKKGNRPIAIIPDPAELRALDLMHRLHDEGRSLAQIAAELDAQGIRPKRGGSAWHRGSVARLLKLPRPQPAEAA
ncbi:MAG: recombinase family protein [Parafilimonas terrae]|nr:recombinase family protein [Parafilimonas terrae]